HWIRRRDAGGPRRASGFDCAARRWRGGSAHRGEPHCGPLSPRSLPACLCPGPAVAGGTRVPPLDAVARGAVSDRGVAATVSAAFAALGGARARQARLTAA